MRNLLSIFSFKTIKEKIVPTKAFLLTLFILILIRLLLFAAGPAFIYINKGQFKMHIGYIIKTLQKKIPETKIHCSAIGSSRTAYSIRTDIMEKNTGWAVSKPTLTGGTPWEYTKIFSYHKNLLDNIDMIIMDLELYQFNDNCPILFHGQENFTELSQIKDRVTYLESSYPLEIIKELWPVHRERRWIKDWSINTINLITSGGLHKAMDKGWYVYEKKGKLNFELSLPDDVVAARHMDNFKYSWFVADACIDLINTCNNKDIPMVIIIPPVKDEYLSNLKQINYDAYDQFMTFINTIKTMNNVVVYLTETTADLQVNSDETDFFIDYGHLSYTGATLYTTWLCNQIQKNEKLTKLLNNRRKSILTYNQQ